jgi:ATP-dependent exoDNAse (exonuclease V) beta subunit
VVWFDPAALRLQVSKAEGIENEQVLQGTPDQAVAGMEKYEAWRARREKRITAGSVPRVRLTTAERLTRCDDADGIDVTTVTLELMEGRPGGRRFGRIVHDILETAERMDEVDALAAVCGRQHGAGDSERAAAAEVARAAMAYLSKAMQSAVVRHREWPMMVRLSDGRIVDGRIDLAWSDGTRWTVVDYKTDRREKRRIGQVQAYGLAVARGTGMPVRCIVLEV